MQLKYYSSEIDNLSVNGLDVTVGEEYDIAYKYRMVESDQEFEVEFHQNFNEPNVVFEIDESFFNSEVNTKGPMILELIYGKEKSL